mmetsp:Transcript_29230/g.52223  ORF Transcript_29230/g.52223 Transcript_29230/m.52223 type:complete len:348 (+) Transcript_29230:58-1101(+)
MSSRLTLEHQRFDRLYYAKSVRRLRPTEEVLTFDSLRAKCDDLQSQIEEAWSAAKTESFSRYHTLEGMLKLSKAKGSLNWKKIPGYKEVQAKLLELKMTDTGNTYAAQLKTVRNILNESKDSQVPLKALLSPNIVRMLSKNKRKFGEQFKFAEPRQRSRSASPKDIEEEDIETMLRQDMSEELLKSTLSERALLGQRGSLSPKAFRESQERSWGAMSLANKVIFESNRAKRKYKKIEVNEEVTLPKLFREDHASSIKLPAIEEPAPFKRKANKRVSQASSPKFRFMVPSKEESHMYKEAERELKDLKSRFNMERLVKQRQKKDKKEGTEMLKIISPSSMKLLDQIKY